MLISGHTQYNAITKTGLGGTKICFDALTNNQIDLYPEYTGTGLLVILHPDSDELTEALVSAETAFNYVDHAFQQQYNLKWLKPLGFSNSYALMMRSEEAKQFGIMNISQLSDYVKSN